MTTTDKLSKVQDAIDAIINLEDIDDLPNDRYRETLKKLREDEHKYIY